MSELKLVVCLKSVPDPRKSYESKMDLRTGVVKRQADQVGIPRIISPLDHHALEEALRIKDACGAEVTVLSMDTPAAREVMREVLAMGADRAVLLSDPAMAGADTLATARALRAAIDRLGAYDLILCGAWSYHGNTGQVGPQLAELLGIVHVSCVKELQLQGSERIRVKSVSDRRYTAYELEFPALITTEEGINTPRQASLMGIVQARSKELEVWDLSDLGLDAQLVGLAGSPSRVTGMKTLPVQRRGEVLRGEPDQVVQELVTALKKAAVL